MPMKLTPTFLLSRLLEQDTIKKIMIYILFLTNINKLPKTINLINTNFRITKSKVFGTFYKIIILSIFSLNSLILNANDLSGLNRLIFKFNDLLSSNEDSNNTDSVKLIGISTLNNRLIILEINKSTFEIRVNEEKKGYKLIEIDGSNAIIEKNNKKYNLKLGAKPININVKNSVFKSNLRSKNTPDNIINDSIILNENNNYQKDLKKQIENINFTKFERSIGDELVKEIGRSTTGRLGVKIPSKIVGQDVRQLGLKDDDVILTINNIPIGNVNDVYKLYKDDTIKTYYVEIKRDNKLRMIEWYK